MEPRKWLLFTVLVVTVVCTASSALLSVSWQVSSSCTIVATIKGHKLRLVFFKLRNAQKVSFFSLFVHICPKGRYKIWLESSPFQHSGLTKLRVLCFVSSSPAENKESNEESKEEIENTHTHTRTHT